MGTGSVPPDDTTHAPERQKNRGASHPPRKKVTSLLVVPLPDGDARGVLVDTCFGWATQGQISPCRSVYAIPGGKPHASHFKRTTVKKKRREKGLNGLQTRKTYQHYLHNI